jgi:hypothetical protein
MRKFGNNILRNNWQKILYTYCGYADEVPGRCLKKTGGSLMNLQLICPKCGKDDNIRKVSVIVAGGTSHDTYRGYDYDYPVTVQTELSRLLALPPEPGRKFYPFIFIGLGLIWTVFNTFIMGSGCLILLVFGFIGGTGFPREGGLELLLMVVPGLAVLSLAFLFTFFLGVVSWRFGINARKKDQERIRHELERWKRVKEKWESSYFHFTDGVVFDREGKDYEELKDKESFQQYLYR